MSVSVWDRMGYKHQQESGISFSYARFFKNWDFLFFAFIPQLQISWLQQNFDCKTPKTRDLPHKKGRSVSVCDRIGYKHQQESGISISYVRFFKKYDFSFLRFPHSHIGPKRRLKTSGFGKIRIFPKVFEENRRYQTERHKKGHSNLEFER